ncbi:MAG: hypothetical protein N3C57_01975 [Aquificaceae bacterium]|nr:hypothetical protein [Aquificaceae bacterium]MCX8075777.1 hypothetical protein [Aquificaceae bacterium]MDW8095536.1 hypothetical protein [Aquificaceae bacterium]
MQNLKERLKNLEKLSTDPFNVEPLREGLEELLKDIPTMSAEELGELRDFLNRLRKRLEENHNICFGWVEEALKKGFRLKA